MYKLLVYKDNFRILKDDEVLLDNNNMAVFGFAIITIDEFINEVIINYINSGYGFSYYKTLESLFKIRDDYKTTYILKDLTRQSYCILETDTDCNIVDERAIFVLNGVDYIKNYANF